MGSSLVVRREASKYGACGPPTTDGPISDSLREVGRLDGVRPGEANILGFSFAAGFKARRGNGFLSPVQFRWGRGEYSLGLRVNRGGSGWGVSIPGFSLEGRHT
jgi:hypothetical protein